MKYTINPLAIALATFLGATSLQAQPQPETIKPGTLLQYRLHFEGPDAADIQSISVYWDRTDPTLPPDQKGRQGEFSAPATKTDASTFEVSIEVPYTTATGDYKMWFRAASKTAMLDYQNPADFSVPVLHIVNDKRIKKPPVNVEQVPVRP